MAGTAGELFARLALRRVRLVDDPVPDRRQDPALRDHVAKEQRVVGHDHVRTGGAPADAVHVAEVGVEPAALAGAVSLRCRDGRADFSAAPMQVDRVEITPRRLRRPRVERRDRRQAILVGALLEFAREPLELSQTRIVVVALERGVPQPPAEGDVELGQLVVDELVHERVGLGRDTDAHVVLERVERSRHQVCDRLADPGPRLDRGVRPRAKRLEHRSGHLELLGPRLVALVHPPGDPAFRELAEHLGGLGACALDLVGIVERLGLIGCDTSASDILQVEEGAGRLGAGDTSQHRPNRPGCRRRERGQAMEQPGWQVRQTHKDDSPHRRERLDVGQRTVRRALGADAERGSKVGQSMRAQPGQGDADQLERVEPRSSQRAAPGDALDERAVERRVVGHDVPPADELHQPYDRRLHALLPGKHLVGDPRELDDLRRQGNQRVDERREGPHDLGATHDRGSDLDDPVAIGVVAGGLDIDHRNLVVEPE